MNIIAVVCKIQQKPLTCICGQSLPLLVPKGTSNTFSLTSRLLCMSIWFFFFQNVSIVQILLREKWCDLLLYFQTHLFTVPKPEECGITTNLGFRADFIMLGTVDLHFGNKTRNYSMPKINIQQASQPSLLKSSEKYRNKQYKAWQNSVPSTLENGYVCLPNSGLVV